MEGVSTAWSIEIQDPPEPLNYNDSIEDAPQDGIEAEDGSSAVAIFEQTIKDPKRDYSITPLGRQQSDNKVEVETSDMQSFLAKQLEVLDKQKQEDDKDREAHQMPQMEMSPLDNNGRVNEYIGPVEYNKDGIQVDVDASLQGIKVSISTPVHCQRYPFLTTSTTGTRSQTRKRGPGINRRRKSTQPSPRRLLRRSGPQAPNSRESFNIIKYLTLTILISTYRAPSHLSTLYSLSLFPFWFVHITTFFTIHAVHR